MENPSPIQMMTNETGDIDTDDLDHLILEEDELPKDNEVFLPDPETVPYLTKYILNQEKEADIYVSTPGTNESVEDKEEEVAAETKH